MTGILGKNIAAKLEAGKSGRNIELKSNFFQVKVKGGLEIFHYDIEINPAATSKAGKNNQLKKFVHYYGNTLFKDFKFAIHDGQKNLFTSEKIKNLDDKSRKTFEFIDKPGQKIEEIKRLIEIEKGNEPKIEDTKPNSDNKKPYPIATLKFAQIISCDTLKALKDSSGKLEKEIGDQEKSDIKQSLMAITGLDIILSHGFKFNDSYSTVGRNFFKRAQKSAVDLGMGKEIWFGFHQSLRPCKRGIMLNIDVAATTFIREQGLLDHCMSVINRTSGGSDNKTGRNNDKNNRASEGSGTRKTAIPAKFTREQIRDLEKECWRLKLTARCGDRSYTFSKFTDKTPTSYKFEFEGKMISVAEYFQTTHKFRVLYPNLQMVQVHPIREIYMPIEFLNVVAGQHYKKKLSPQGTAQMVKSCAKKPDIRQKEIEKFATNNKYNDDKTIKGNCKIVDKMVEFEGRVLETPEILYRNGETARCNMGAWEMKERGKKESKQYFEPVDVETWFIIGAEPEKIFKKSDLDAMGQKFMKVATEVGMKMKAPRVTILKESRDRNARMKLLEEIVKHCLKLKPNLIMLVLGQQDGYLYNKMKSLGDVQYGVHTQCILSKNAKGNKLNPQLINNVQGVRKNGYV